MRLLLNAGFGDPLGTELFGELRRLGFDGIRQDVLRLDRVEELVRDAAAGAGDAWQPFVIFVVEWGAVTAELAVAVAQFAHGRIPEFAIEVGNELNIPDPNTGRAPVKPTVYGHAFNEIRDAIHLIDPTIHVVTAGISSLSKDSQRWLAAAPILGPAVIGYHDYRTDDDPRPEAPQKGFGSRDMEFDNLRRLAGPRPIWNTEVGWHTAVRKRGLWGMKKYRVSDTEAASYLVREADLTRKRGSDVMVVYQLNDGPKDEPLHRYGIRDFAGNWKPQARVAQEHRITRGRRP